MMINNKILVLVFGVISSFCWGQNIENDTKIKPLPFKSIFNKQNDTLFHIEGKDTFCVYPYIESKIIKIHNTYFALRFSNEKGEEFVIEDTAIHKYLAPSGPAYNDFTNNFKIWDVDSSHFWNIYGISMGRTQLGSPIFRPSGSLERIPHKDLNMWVKERRVSDFFPRFDYYDMSNKLPLSEVIFDKYVIQQREKREKGPPYLFLPDKPEIFDSIRQKTFFDFLVINSKAVYFLYHEKELSIWEINEENRKNNAYFHWDKKDSFNIELSSFRVFEYHKNFYIIDHDCTIYKIENQKLQKVLKLDYNLKDITLLIDKDNDNILFVDRKDIREDESLKDIFQKKGRKIFP